MVGRSVWLVLGRQSDAAAVALSAVGQTELSVRPPKGNEGANANGCIYIAVLARLVGFVSLSVPLPLRSPPLIGQDDGAVVEAAGAQST